MGRGLILWQEPLSDALFPDSVIDETDLCGISNPFELLSPTKG